MERPLARSEAVRVLGIHVEVRAAILEDDAGTRRHHPRTKSAEEALNHGQDVALAVGDDEACGIAVHVAPRVELSLSRIEVRAAAIRVALGKEPLDRRPRLR